MILPHPHIRAWYSYSFAAEMYAIPALALFLPLTLERDSITPLVPSELINGCRIGSDDWVLGSGLDGAMYDSAQFARWC